MSYIGRLRKRDLQLWNKMVFKISSLYRRYFIRFIKETAKLPIYFGSSITY